MKKFEIGKYYKRNDFYFKITHEEDCELKMKGIENGKNINVFFDEPCYFDFDENVKEITYSECSHFLDQTLKAMSLRLLW